MDDSTKHSKRSIVAFVGAYIGDLLMLGLALVVVWASFGNESDAYDFPKLVAVLLLLFAFINIVKIIMRAPHHTTSLPISASVLRRLLPAICIVSVYIYVCDIIGFYWSALPAFVMLAACYGGALNKRQWKILALATLLVMGGVYVLFDVVLQVQTPEPFWVD